MGNTGHRGLFLNHMTDLDLCTALFSTVPGGLSEMSVISGDMSADPALVSVFQLSRMVATVCTFPIFIAHILKAEKQGASESQKRPADNHDLSLSDSRKQFLISAAIACLAGILGRYTRFPGGVLLFSAAASSFLQIRFGIGWLLQSAPTLISILTTS